LASTTTISTLSHDKISTEKIDPTEFEISRSPISDLRGGDSAHNARITMAIFEGESGAPRDAVLLNAAAAIAAYEGRSDINVKERIELGLARATEAVDSGAAKNLVKQWAILSNQLA
jgi:anthranilate phosphoribosyltransferase